MSENAAAIEWAILELMGHRRLAGYVSEQQIAGVNFVRLDVFAAEPPGAGEDAEEPIATQFYSAAAVYCITPTTEEMARAVGASRQPQPVQRWELPAAVAASAERDEDWHGD